MIRRKFNEERRMVRRRLYESLDFDDLFHGQSLVKKVTLILEGRSEDIVRRLVWGFFDEFEDFVEDAEFSEVFETFIAWVKELYRTFKFYPGVDEAVDEIILQIDDKTFKNISAEEFVDWLGKKHNFNRLLMQEINKRNRLKGGNKND